MATTEKVTASFTRIKYANYAFTASDTFVAVADKFSTTVPTLAKINNLTGSLPKYIKDAKQLKNASFILVPLLNNGGNWTTPNYYYQLDKKESLYPTDYASLSSTLQGSGGGVVIMVNGNAFAIPCYPKSVSDSLQVQFNSDSLFTSTEPYFVFHHSGPRTIQVGFQFHREMRGIDNDGYIDTIVNALKASVYPVNDGWMGSEIILIVGNDVYIRGIISGSVGVSYSGPIIDGKYNVIDVNFSIEEVQGGTLDYATKFGIGH